MADGILNPIEQLEADLDFEVYTKQEVDALLDEKADKSDTYTKTETDALLDDKADADAVYTKTETDTLLSAKADKSTTLAGYGITDAYTKTQTDTLLNGKADADSVYTKTEINTKIPNTVGSATKPTYVNGGVITECTYELNKTVPANAVFTDTIYTAGNGLNLSGTSFSAKAGTNVTVDGNGINVNGSGVVASADSGLISGGTAYTELRPTLDGTWVKNAQTTAINLQKLEGGIEYLYAILSKQYDQLKKYINGNYYDYDTDTDSKYTKSVPQGAMPYASLEQIGGKTLVWNQLLNAGTISVATTDTATQTVGSFNGVNSHKYLLIWYQDTTLTSNTRNTMALDDGPGLGSAIYEYSGSNHNLSAGWYSWFVNPTTLTSGTFTVFYWGHSPNVAYNITNIMCFDLTDLYEAGNEPTTVAEFEQMFPAQYYSYNAGTLLSAGVTGVVSKKADTTTLATYSIPAEVRALSGYGWSCPSHYNYIDFEAKKFVQEVGSRAYASGDESDSTVVTDKTTTYYPLNPAVETDISAYLTDNLIEVEAGGTLVFQNSNGTDYQIPVPSSETFMVDLQSALGE